MTRRMALMKVRGSPDPPSLAEAAVQLGVDLSALDASFGVVLIDPAAALYAVEVDADRLPGSNAATSDFRGPFSNPPIAGFNEQEEDSEK